MVELGYEATVRNAFAQGAISERDQHGRITYVNRRFSEVSKYSKEELLANGYDSLNFSDVSNQLLTIIMQTISAGKIFNGILKDRASDGSPYWVDATIVPIKNKIGEVVKYVEARYPITSEVMAEYLYKKQAEKLGLSVA